MKFRKWATFLSCSIINAAYIFIMTGEFFWLADFPICYIPFNSDELSRSGFSLLLWYIIMVYNDSQSTVKVILFVLWLTLQTRKRWTASVGDQYLHSGVELFNSSFSNCFIWTQYYNYHPKSKYVIWYDNWTFPWVYRGKGDLQTLALTMDLLIAQPLRVSHNLATYTKTVANNTCIPQPGLSLNSQSPGHANQIIWNKPKL